MKKGISYWCFDGGLSNDADPIEVMKQAKKAGFDSVELGFVPKNAKGALGIDAKTSKKRCEEIKAAAKKIGIEISSMCSGMYWEFSFTSAKKSTQDKVMKLTESYIEKAAWLGAKAVLVVPGHSDVLFMPSEKVQYDVAYKVALKAMKKLSKVAEKNKITVCLENVWNGLFLSPVEFSAFLKAVGSSRVKAYFDVGNVAFSGRPEDWIRILKSQIGRVHIKDYKRAFDATKLDKKLQKNVSSVFGFCDIGKGDIDFKAVKKALKDVKYNGYLTAEQLVIPDVFPLVTAKNNINVTSKGMDMVMKA